MVSVVNDNCIKCKSCADVCPVDAFREGDTQLVVEIGRSCAIVRSIRLQIL